MGKGEEENRECCVNGKPLKGFQQSTDMVRSVSEVEYDDSNMQDGDEGNKFWIGRWGDQTR